MEAELTMAITNGSRTGIKAFAGRRPGLAFLAGVARTGSVVPAGRKLAASVWVEGRRRRVALPHVRTLWVHAGDGLVKGSCEFAVGAG